MQKRGRAPLVRQGREWNKPSVSGMWGWLDRDTRGNVTLELSHHSRAALARENCKRIIDEWRSYLLPEGTT